MKRFAIALALLPSLLAAQAKPAAPAKPPRLLYVLDAETESPIAGAKVTDMITRNSMETSKDGVVGLLVPAFVKGTGALIEVRMTGYQTSERVMVDPLSDTTLVVYLMNIDRKRQVVRRRTDSTVFQIEVLDETGGPLRDAIVTVVRGLATALASRVTDSTGKRQLVVPEVHGDVQITAQRIGYNPYRQFYRLSYADTVVAQIAMARLAQQLEGVTVKANNVKRRIYHVDENEIANSRRNLLDALDVIRKLRPTMFGDRTRGIDGCGTADYIFVNGRRVFRDPRDLNLKRLPPYRVGSRTARGTGGPGIWSPPRPTPMGEAAASASVRAVLATIKPEHVSEMTYLDCFDTSVPGLHTNNAIYVVLKYGVEYDVVRGSFFTNDSVPRK